MKLNKQRGKVRMNRKYFYRGSDGNGGSFNGETEKEHKSMRDALKNEIYYKVHDCLELNVNPIQAHNNRPQITDDWISVKDRLPEESDKKVLIYREMNKSQESSCVETFSARLVKVSLSGKS